MNSSAMPDLNTMVCIPCGEILNFNDAVLSVTLLPENALISGNLACSAGSKFEASYTSNCSRAPAAFGNVMIIDALACLSTTENNCCLKGAIVKLNNLYSLG